MINSLLVVVFALGYCVCFARNKDIEALKKVNADWIGSYVIRDTLQCEPDICG